MYEQIPIDLITLLMFVVPGYFVVWSFHTTNKSEPKSEFERLIFSAFWGVVMICLFPLISSTEQFSLLVGNPFATMLTFSFIGISVGFFGATLVEAYKDMRSPTFRKKLLRLIFRK